MRSIAISGTRNTMLVSLLIFAADPFLGEWMRAEALERLACVTAWENLCSTHDTDFPTVIIEAKRVIVRPYMEESELVFQIKSRTPTRLDLAGKDCRAQITREGEVFTWDGVDVAEFLRGEVVQTKMKLVKTRRFLAVKKALVKALVPGGKCQGLMVGSDTPGPCLNKKN
jgi:hypothetical protein